MFGGGGDNTPQKSRRWWTAALLLWLLPGLAACGIDSAPGVTVTDSAGIRTTVSQDVERVFAALDSLPTLSLGGPEASGPAQFFRVQGIHVDAAGRLWVADGQSGELRIFQSDGSHWKTRGGVGEGPGEFLQIRLLGASGADTVSVGDSRVDRITVFSPDGEFVRTESVPSSHRPAPRPIRVFSDGSVLGQLPRIVPAASLEPGQILADSVELVRVRLDSLAIEPYGSATGPLWLWTGRSQVPIPFTANASFDVLGDEVHLVSGAEFRVRVLESGELREVYGVDRAIRPVTRSDIVSYQDLVREYVPEQARTDYLSALDPELLPAVVPGYDRVLVSLDGHVWAQVYESDAAAAHDWDVFDEGAFVGRVHVWSGFHPMTVTQHGLVGVWRDALGVEHVRAYGFSRRLN